MGSASANEKRQEPTMEDTRVDPRSQAPLVDFLKEMVKEISKDNGMGPSEGKEIMEDTMTFGGERMTLTFGGENMDFQKGWEAVCT